ncbi:S8 family serine peptidase [Candidatus Woesearchaeota archaeon]|nr:S8 family serine peptidase [Candidatus Woesearchaeota archaeon]
MSVRTTLLVIISFLCIEIASAAIVPYIVTTNSTVQRDTFFNISTGVTCEGICGNITAILDPISDRYIEEHVQKTLNNQSRVQVIITFETDLVTAQAISMQSKKVAIDRKQDRIVNSLNRPLFQVFGMSVGPKNIEQVTRYETIPSLAGSITQKGLDMLLEDPDIKTITTIKPVHISLTQSSPLIQAEQAWNLYVNSTNITGKGETICVVDTGIDTDHAGFQDRIVAEYCYCTDNCCPDNTPEDTAADDDNGHGTHCASIAAGNYNQYIGVAPEANIVAIKVLDSAGSGYNSDVIAGIDWCVDNAATYNISVISLSLGGGSRFASACDGSYPSEATVINTAVSQDIFVVAATGNDADYTGISSPACVANAVSVGAVFDYNYGHGWSYSSCSDTSTAADKLTCFTNRESIMDLLAPGAEIIAFSHTGGTTAKHGTSQATPQVAGAAALMKQYYRTSYGHEISPLDIKTKLQNAGKKLYDTQTDEYYPRIDLSTTLPKGVVPYISSWNGADPFYTTTTNPNTDGCLNNLNDGENCTTTWTVNATQIGEWDFFTIYEDGTERNLTEHFKITIVEDLTPPIVNITLNSPFNQSYITGSLINFSYIVDATDTITYCTLLIDGIQVANDTSVTRNISDTISWSADDGGTLAWNIQCFSDDGGDDTGNGAYVFVSHLTGFDGATTSLGGQNLSNITNMVLEKISYGSINFSESIDLSQGGDIPEFVTISQNTITIDTTNLPALNRSATLTLKNINIENPLILQDGQVCADCTIVSNAGGVISFTVSHFTTYSIGANSNLVIYDSVETNYSEINTSVTFYANYTNHTSGNHINDASCQIFFSDDPTVQNMTNTGTQFTFEHNFSTYAFHWFNVTCNRTGYSTLSAVDDVLIAGAAVGGQGGYVTILNLSQSVRSTNWHFFYGRANASVRLRDDASNVAFDWGDIRPSYIIAARSTISFANVTCANDTHQDDEEVLLGLSTASDNLHNTFGTPDHPLITLSPDAILPNTCNTTHLNVNGTNQSSVFKQVILYDVNNDQILYTGYVYNSTYGYNYEQHDYQIIVPDDGTVEDAPDYLIYIKI